MSSHSKRPSPSGERQPEISPTIVVYSNPFEKKVVKQAPFFDSYDWLQQQITDALQQKIEKQKRLVHELLRLDAVRLCSGPSVFSRIFSAR
jgi:hypothetical protein